MSGHQRSSGSAYVTRWLSYSSSSSSREEPSQKHV
eukprot:CAMPEP_0171778210 /NCGR_PEP_ID=MMETSP0991-20121206/58258_1 /TAXON_ID=483369 /ORGANISM="non described non described, Strain CCMP2098" /LENGTH=34 /DNA_ID= /DNA_START= /DNA_END= /DNA_ORIENTATION=